MRPEIATGIALLFGFAGVVVSSLALIAFNRMADAFERMARNRELGGE